MRRHFEGGGISRCGEISRKYGIYHINLSDGLSELHSLLAHASQQNADKKSYIAIIYIWLMSVKILVPSLLCKVAVPRYN